MLFRFRRHNIYTTNTTIDTPIILITIYNTEICVSPSFSAKFASPALELFTTVVDGNVTPGTDPDLDCPSLGDRVGVEADGVATSTIVVGDMVGVKVGSMDVGSMVGVEVGSMDVGSMVG